MKRFIALYFLFLGSLFILFYMTTSSFSVFSVEVNRMQTLWTLEVLRWFLKPEQLQGIDIWITPQYKIIITQACNGVIPILFYFASILAYHASLKDKIVWMLLGYVLFFIVNIVRILLVVYVTQNGDGQGDFYWSHDLLGNILLLITGLGLFVAFIQRSERL